MTLMSLGSIGLSIYTSGMAALISFLIGTPFAYLLARKNFFGKKLVESIIDLPIMIPHPVVGIAILCHPCFLDSSPFNRTNRQSAPLHFVPEHYGCNRLPELRNTPRHSGLQRI